MTFEIIKRTSIYQGHAFSVEKCQTRLPDGSLKTYDVVRHQPAVTMVPVDAAGLLYFVRQFRIGPEQSLLEFPAGVLEPGEDPEEGASREIREEIGLAASKLKKIGEFFLAPGYSSEHMYVFLATELYQAPLQADADEFLKVEMMPVQKAFDMAEKGSFLDSKTLSALYLARPFLV
jgi:ADP-ribose pyrophosphatase